LGLLLFIQGCGFLGLFVIIAEAALLSFACSLDTFAAAFAYGSKNIKIPFISAFLINIVCSFSLGLALLGGVFIRPFLPEFLTAIIAFSILFIIGLIKLLDSATKSIIKKIGELETELKFSLFNFNFILGIYAEPEKADLDKSKIISSGEAVLLALALSLDGIAAGIAASLGNINWVMVLIFSLILNIVAIIGGEKIGSKIREKLPFNLSWISGIVLIALAVLNLI